MRVSKGLLLGWVLALFPLQGMAITFDFDFLGNRVDAVINNAATFGYSWRLHDQASDLIGKGNLDPNVCGDQFQTCQGLHRLQSFPAERLAAAPGAPSINFDDGNLNYDKGDVTQAPFKLTQDIRFLFGNYGIFYRAIGIYDYINYNDFEMTKPNLITPENFARVGQTSGLGGGRYYPRVYGPGEFTKVRRPNDEAEEAGLRYDILDFNFFGSVPYAEGTKNLTFRIGRQTVNWGQSTVAVVNSLNQAQPVNANALYRLGFGLLEELFVPVGMIRASTEVASGLTLEAFYQFEWLPIEIPTAGSYMSFADIGTDNQRTTVNASFGSSAEDPFSLTGGRLNNPLTTITPTSLTLQRDPDREARDQGQFGVSLKYYSDNINNGTEFGFYAMNYHSKLPYVSFTSTDASCARREGNPQGRDARNIFEFLQSCPNLPVTAPSASGQLLVDLTALIAQRPGVLGDLGLTDGSNLLGVANLLLPRPNLPAADSVPFDTASLFLEYPEDLQVYGVDFTTTFGEYSFQGEIAYRPNVPLQVSIIDLAFASFGPVLTRCHDPEIGCVGASAGLGYDAEGNYVIYEGNDFTNADGVNPYKDTFSLVVGAAPGSARSFPNFIMPYRGVAVGETEPNSYIRGWIPGKVAQYNLGATRVLGGSENWIAADQVILIYELAATHVLNMPDYDELQIEGPLSPTPHASAGADGSGADGGRLACSTNTACSVGPDGLRFNPYQASRNQFANEFSWGYRVVGRISYESVLPGISIQPLFIWQHDISGNAPGPAGNFVEGRKTLNFLLETRYEKALSFTVAYNTFFDGGTNNVYRDRDNLGFFVKYLF